MNERTKPLHQVLWALNRVLYYTTLRANLGGGTIKEAVGKAAVFTES